MLDLEAQCKELGIDVNRMEAVGRLLSLALHSLPPTEASTIAITLYVHCYHAGAINASREEFLWLCGMAYDSHLEGVAAAKKAAH